MFSLGGLRGIFPWVEEAVFFFGWRRRFFPGLKEGINPLLREGDFVPGWEEGDFSLDGRRGIFSLGGRRRRICFLWVGEKEFFSEWEDRDFTPGYKEGNFS